MGARMKEDQQRVRTLLTDTVTLLCKNGLTFQRNIKVQGLLGITIDDEEVFIVHLNENLGDALSVVSGSDSICTDSPVVSHRPRHSPSKSDRRPRTPTKRRRSGDASPPSTPSRASETIDLDPDIEIKSEPGVVELDSCDQKFRPRGGERGGGMPGTNFSDEGLDFAINSISGVPPGSIPVMLGPPSKRQASEGYSGLPVDTNSSVFPSTSANNSPFVTGFMRNTTADNSNQSDTGSGLAWDSNAAQGSSAALHWHPESGQPDFPSGSQLQGPGSGPGAGMIQWEPTSLPSTSKDTPSAYNCMRCKQLLRQFHLGNKRKKQRAVGVPEDQLSKFSEQCILPSDPNCQKCFVRKHRRRARRAQSKLTKLPDTMEEPATAGNVSPGNVSPGNVSPGNVSPGNVLPENEHEEPVEGEEN